MNDAIHPLHSTALLSLLQPCALQHCSYHGFTSTVLDAACLALNAGTDLALGGEYASTLGQCVTRGNVTTARIAQALTRILTAHMDLGW